ncbi:L,D-transpeptidase family protein [Sporolactobacillus pectinivorans]|uniref:L,D-transpeptidase family protein n=1 Tax=Sporolactobacillus pectinivorans TaxID=1591408 RepID=UPI0012FDEA0B|nr:L,D-transpeptidase family protein [Sporolactobacillus pectinivorans]
MKSNRKIVSLFVVCLLVVVLLFNGSDAEAQNNIYSKSVSEQIVDQMKTIRENKQLILVTASGYHKDSVTVQTFNRGKNNKWQRVLITTGIIGKSGFTHSFSEWSEGSPVGKYTITQAFGRYKNPGTNLPYHRISKSDVWVDNVHSKYYNTLQNMYRVHQYSEKMNIPQYDYGFVINYNTQRVRGKGSAVFFHIALGKYKYTLGCTAVSEENVVRIMKWLNPKDKPVIIQTVQSELNKF